MRFYFILPIYWWSGFQMVLTKPSHAKKQKLVKLLQEKVIIKAQIKDEGHNRNGAVLERLLEALS